ARPADDDSETQRCLSKNRHSGSNALNFTQCGNYYENLTRLELVCKLPNTTCRATIEAMH
ncbi:hypothetical protein LT991_13880, partial [Leptospira interrogans serovar Canicola]|uniref:hypothetical protein n=1 Tax=Leptospira interrogans TaxID=173 RepID=UPI001F0DDDE0